MHLIISHKLFWFGALNSGPFPKMTKKKENENVFFLWNLKYKMLKLVFSILNVNGDHGYQAKFAMVKNNIGLTNGFRRFGK